ncbi:12026_t:CDS:2, partial [Ambispora gerdemannii]
MSRRALISILRRPVFNNFRYLSVFSEAQRKERNALLKEIYTPSFSQFEKGSKEYLDLDYYKEHQSFLEEMSTIKDTIEIPTIDLLKHMI